jgi:hypothetical protein
VSAGFLRVTLLAVAACASRAQISPPGGSAAWLTDRFLKIHMELNVPHRLASIGERFNDESFQRAIRASGIQAAVLFAKDAYGNAFFNTRYNNKARGLSFDLVERQVRLLHGMGIQAVVHYSVGDDSRIDLFHPEWLCSDISGKPLHGGPISNRACLNSAYREELLLPQLEELVRLGVDGIWLDIFRTPVDCFCASCRTKFRSRYGAELTPSDARREAFWADSADEALAEISRRTRAVNPNLAITFNGAHLLRHARRRLVDFFTVESHVSLVTGYEIHHMQARYLRALDVPFDIQFMTNAEHWDDSTLKSPVQLTAELSEILASGGRVSAGTQLYPWGEYEEAGARVLGEAYAFARERLPFLAGARAVRHAAVLVPEVAPGTGSWRIGADLALVGLTTALTRLHVQFDILEGSNSGYELLANYKVAILPAPGRTLQDAAGREALSKFRRSGGKVILISDEQALPAETANVFGFNVSATRIHVARGRISGGRLRDFPYSGDVTTFHGPTDEPLIDLFDSQDRGVAAGGLLSRQIAWLGWPFGEVFYETRFPEWLRLLGAVISAVDPEPPYSVQGSPHLLTNLMERRGELLLHLVHVSAQKPLPGIPPAIWAPTRLYDVSGAVHCRRPERITLEPAGRDVPFTYDGRMARFEIPEVETYEIVRVALPR